MGQETFDIDQCVSLSVDLRVESVTYPRGTEGLVVAVLGQDDYLVSLFPRTERVRVAGHWLEPAMLPASFRSASIH